MDKKNRIIGLLIFIIIVLFVSLIDTRMSIQNNIKSIEVQPIKEKVVFVGDSITEGYDLKKYFDYNDKLIINSGISGYRTDHILTRFKNLVEQHQADKMFLMIGTNDLGNGRDPDYVVSNIKKIIEMAKEKSPNTKIYYQTIYPFNKKMLPKDKRDNEDIKYINEEIRRYCEVNNITYLDVYSLLVDKNDNLKKEYTKDGLHLNDRAYTLITDYLKPYVEE